MPNPNPQLEYLPDEGKWRLLSPLVTPEHTVPAKFETDGATVPRFLWPFFPRVGRYLAAAIVHDWMYVNAIGTKRQADKLFLLNMQRDGVPRISRHIMYLAVRLFGRGQY